MESACWQRPPFSGDTGFPARGAGVCLRRTRIAVLERSSGSNLTAEARACARGREWEGGNGFEARARVIEMRRTNLPERSRWRAKECHGRGWEIIVADHHQRPGSATVEVQGTHMLAFCLLSGVCSSCCNSFVVSLVGFVSAEIANVES